MPRPSLNLHFFGGRTIADLVYVNRYLGGPSAWDPADVASIDAALAKAMSDNALQSVLQQYYEPAISSRMLPSAVLPGRVPATVYKDQVEALAARIYGGGALGDADPGRTLVNIMLPRGVVLVDGFSPGFRPSAGTEAEHERRLRAVVKVDSEDADSRHGLGGYHGSTNVAGTAVYYAVGVYSEDGNGIPVFDQPWKNVAATFYHELNEARTDPDVEDAIRTGDSSRLGWYSAEGGEVGDIPAQRGRDQPRPRLHRDRTGRRLGRRPGPADVVEQGRRACPPHRVASPSLPCGVAQPPGGPRQGPPGWRPRRPVNARWFAAWTTGSRLPPARPRPAGSAKGLTAKDAEFPHCPFLPQRNFPVRQRELPAATGNCGKETGHCPRQRGMARSDGRVYVAVT